MRVAVVLLAALSVLALAACGGDDNGGEASPPPPPADTTTPETTTAESGDETAGDDEEMADGAAVFASAGCGGCHTLEAAGSTGAIGPELTGANLSEEQVADQVRNGGGAMPAFSDQLSDEQIQAVARYVSNASSS